MTRLLLALSLMMSPVTAEVGTFTAECKPGLCGLPMAFKCQNQKGEWDDCKTDKPIIFTLPEPTTRWVKVHAGSKEMCETSWSSTEGCFIELGLRDDGTVTWR